MKKFYETIKKLNNELENRTVTVLGGPYCGEQAVFSGHEPVWCSAGDGFIPAHKDEILAAGGGGVVRIGDQRLYIEFLSGRKELVICGAGHVALAIIRIARMVGFGITLIEDRSSYAEEGRQAGADRVVCDDFERALDQLPGGPDTFFVIVTRDHSNDIACLRKILLKEHAYIGMMGSSRRIRMVKESLTKEGFEPAILDSLHAPIGLGIKADSPEEIAIAVLAEIIQIKNSVQDVFYAPEILNAACAAYSGDRNPVRKIMATIIARQGSAPRRVGTKMLLLQDGTSVGTIGGGNHEACVIEEAGRMFLEEAPLPRPLHLDLMADADSANGDVCGGILDVWLQEV